MFDDITPPSQAPSNLPVGKPVDIFDRTDAAEAESVRDQARPPSALDSGMLEPKKVEPETQPEAMPVERTPPPRPAREEPTETSAPKMTSPPTDIYALKEPGMSRGLVTGVVVFLGVILLGGGGWWAYRAFMGPKTEPGQLVPPAPEAASVTPRPADNEPEIPIQATRSPKT